MLSNVYNMGKDVLQDLIEMYSRNICERRCELCMIRFLRFNYQNNVETISHVSCL